MNENPTSRRRFLFTSSILLAGVPLLKINLLKAGGLKNQQLKIVHNTPIVVTTDHRLNLDYGVERLVMDEGLQPSMLCTRTNALIVQSQIASKPFPQKRIFYPFAMKTVVSRDNGNSWKEFGFPKGDNGVDIEGGITQLRDGTILALETYVTPGEKPDQGAGLLYYSKDDFKTLRGPIDITFNIPDADFYGSTDDGGRPHAAMRLHRRILELPNGDLLTTIYGWMKGDNAPCDYQPKMKKTRVMFFKSTNKGRHWDYVSTVAVDPKVGTEGFGEPTIAYIHKGKHKGRIICFMRTGIELYQAHSDDGGKSWQGVKPLQFADRDVYNTALWKEMFKEVIRGGKPVIGNPVEDRGAVVDPDLLVLRSGIVVAVFGLRIPAKACWQKPEFPWNGNYIAFSEDGGDSWSNVIQLTSAIDTTHYMAVEETVEDNKIFVVYDFGHWNGKQGRYTYGRPIKISKRKA